MLLSFILNQVSKACTFATARSGKYVMKLIQSRRGGLVSELRAELCNINGILHTAEKQELYMTISKLVALLEEV
ncbi:hypothetical protein LINPERPRIM_LOCUS5248 [Linum perenne]